MTSDFPSALANALHAVTELDAVDQMALGFFQLHQGPLGLFVDHVIDQPGLYFHVSDQRDHPQKRCERPSIGAGIHNTRKKHAR